MIQLIPLRYIILIEVLADLTMQRRRVIIIKELLIIFQPIRIRESVFFSESE